MKTVTTNVYDFCELSRKAKDNAIRMYGSSVAEDRIEMDGYEYRDTLASIEETFGISVIREGFWLWNESRWSDVDEEAGGRMLLRYLNEIDGRIDRAREYWKNGKKRLSRIIKVAYDWSVYNGQWTGEAVDEAMMNGYDDVRQGRTIREFVNNMLRSFYSRWEEDNAHAYDEENIEEGLEMQDWGYMEDGRRFLN